jgi:hypothetical protein
MSRQQTANSQTAEQGTVAVVQAYTLLFGCLLFAVCRLLFAVCRLLFAYFY